MDDRPIRPQRLLIADWIPSLNKGELAILAGMLKTFEAFTEEMEVSIFSFSLLLDKERYPENVKKIDIVSDLHLRGSLPEIPSLLMIPVWLFAMLQHICFSMLYAVTGDKALRIMSKEVWRDYCRSDVIITCHDEVSCVYGHRLLRFFPIYITLLAKTLGKPVVIYGNGCFSNPLQSSQFWLWKILARHVLSNVDLITVRDEESYKVLKSVSGGKARIHLTADPAFLLIPASRSRVRQIMFEEKINKGDRLLIGMTLSSEILESTYSELGNPEERRKEATAQIAMLVDRLINNFHASIVFLPHCIEPYRRRDDREVAREIYNSAANKDNISLVNKEYSAEELKGLIGIFDLFIGGRVHSVISALSMGVPSITLTRASDKRAYGIIGKMLKQQEWICNIEGLNLDELFSKITALLSLRNKVKTELAVQTSLATEAALINGKLLRTLLDSRARSRR